jgi:LPS-assembly protein
MEHFQDEDKYVAIGNVKLQKDNTVVYADKATFFAKAAHVEAEGHVIYEDPATLINAERTELNMDTKTGRMFKAVIVLKDQKGMEKKGVNKKIDFWINSDKVEKINDGHYYASAATFTSCETIAEAEGRYQGPSDIKVFGPDNPDWCFKGSNVDILIGDRIAGNDMVYRVDGLPVMYLPYFRAPEGADRSTGLLFPVLGNSTVKGLQFSPGFFWAIDENKDATLSLDYFSKRGVGEGIEYRYLDFDDKGKWYVYHLSDSQEKKTDYVVKGTHYQNFGDITVSADINYVNQWDYYNQFSTQRNERIERYTQSSAEVSAPLGDSRLYLLGQYWVDLQVPPQLQTPPLPPTTVPQRLPELGYVVNPTNIGPLMFSMNSSIADFTRSNSNIDDYTRTNDVSGQRLVINPKLSYAFGDSVRIFQSLSASETAYHLANFGTTSGPDLHHESFNYTVNALTRFFKQYESGTHIIEPSLSFSYMPGHSHPLPLFDSVDVNNSINYSQPTSTTALLNKTALAQFSVLNTLALKDLFLSARLTQPYSFNAAANAVANYITPSVSDHSLQPTVLQGSLVKAPITLSMTEAEDLTNLKEQTSAATISAVVAEGTSVSISRYYAYALPVSTLQYSAGFSTVLSKTWTFNGNVWYVEKQGGVQDFALHALYTAKCWGLDVLFERKPPDTIHPPEYSFTFLVSLKGFGGFKLYGYSSTIQ